MIFTFLAGTIAALVEQLQQKGQTVPHKDDPQEREYLSPDDPDPPRRIRWWLVGLVLVGVGGLLWWLVGA